MTDIKVEQEPAPHVRSYHTRVQLTERSIEHSSEINAGALSRLLSGLPGVAGVYVKRYEVTVSRALAFSWDEVEPAILEVLAAFTPLPPSPARDTPPTSD